MRYYIATLVIVLFGAISCDIIEPPYTEGGDPNDTNSTTVQRVILLEDFSGVNCVNCPDATRLIKTMKESAALGDKFIPVVFHAGIFARPTRPYHPEFRTPEGTQLHNTIFDGIGYPMGLINRVVFDGGRAIDFNSWPTVIGNLAIGAEAEVDIKLSVDYNAANRTANIEAEVSYLVAGAAAYNISFYLLEDGVIAYQKDGNIDNMEYEHNFLMRRMINGVWGQPISPGVVPRQGETHTATSSIRLDDEWQAENCSIVAFVHIFDEGGSHPRNFEVLQATQAKIIP